MPEQQQPQNATDPLAQMSWKEKHQFVVGLLTFPALTLMVFLRRMNGFRQLKPSKIIAIGLALIAIANIGPDYLPQSLVAPRMTDATAARAPSTIPPGLDAPLPAEWNRMNYGQRRAWAGQHQLTPEQQRERQERAQADARAEQQAAEKKAALARALVKWPLIVFALAFMVSGLVQRRRRWNGLCRGVLWHTRSRGISRLKPLLEKLLPERHIVRFADPGIALIAGLALLGVSRALGAWVIGSSFALYMVEQSVFDRQLDSLCDDIDNFAEAKVRQETMSDFDMSGGPGQSTQRSTEQTAGIPTGIAPDIEAQVARLKARRARQAQEDKAA